jgi:predicted transcriptional regulator
MQFQHTHSKHGTVESNRTVERSIEPISSVLESPRTKLVYLYLTMAGEGTVDDVHDALGIKLISLYPVLETLIDNGLVQRDGSRYVCSTA